MRARLAAHEMHARHDARETTKKARAASPSDLSWYYDQVDPDRKLSEAERDRRAASARKAHFTRLAFMSSRARSAKAATNPSGGRR